jgi:hypothetical protein
VRSFCLLLLLAALICGCGSSDGASNDRAAPDYAGTARTALESWVSAVRAGDTEMMCQLLSPRSVCTAANKQALMETKFLPDVRAEMRGLKGDLHYGAIDIGGPAVLIGVVSGESPAAYAVRVVRGKTQWRISEETYARGLAPQIVLNHPDPATVLTSGRTAISFTAWAYTPGSVYPNAELWIDSRHVDGRVDPGPDKGFGLEQSRWTGAAHLLPGRHVMVAAVREATDGIAANAWLLTVR